jgi:hypothetical protein
VIPALQELRLRHKKRRPKVLDTPRTVYPQRATSKGAHFMAEKIISQVPDGSYSPIKGPNSITFCGNLIALAKTHQVDTNGIFEGDYSRVFEAKDNEGHTWFVRWLGKPFFTAFRDPTAQEIEEEIDRADSMAGVNVERVRLDACRIVAKEMSALADGMRPEQCPSRQRRRAVKSRMLALTTLQRNLLSLKEVNTRALREEMSSLGLPLPRRDYWGVGSAQ